MQRFFRSPGLAAVFAALALPALAQDTPGQRVRLFLTCSTFYCEPAFYQTEIAFVDHVRDRSDADVHVLATPESTGGGGTQYTLAFLGQGRFAGQDLTLTHVAEANTSEDRLRQALANVIKLGLVRYVAQTPEGARLSVTYAAPAGAAAAAAPARDPWNHWSFRLSGNGFFNGEQSYSSRQIWGSASASRTTERWKLRLSMNVNESHNRFEIDSVTTFTNTQTSRGLSGLLVRSLGHRLSAGLMGSASRSTYLNQDMALRIAPAIEYNFYPYSESTRRQMLLRYAVGPTHFDYLEETIFERSEETRLQHSLVAAVVARQPWGSVHVSGEAAAFLDDHRKNRLEIGGGTELNLFRGFALELNGVYERVRDQLYLPAGEATEEEILLRQRQLATGFQYFLFAGISYTFGSRSAPVVNPRFTSGGGVFLN